MQKIVIYYSTPEDYEASVDAVIAAMGEGFRFQPMNASHYGGHVIDCDAVVCKDFPDIDADYAEAGIPNFDAMIAARKADSGCKKKGKKKAKTSS